MQRTWALVLAGGDGTRLLESARARYGYDRAKQFCDFDGNGTLLERTLRRVHHVVPEDRVVVATTRRWEHEASACLTGFSQAIQVIQPRNLDTTPGILLPLLFIASADPHATVAVVPSDHHVDDEAAASRALANALDAVDRHPEDVVLIGARPATVEHGYGWIVPKTSRGGLRRVASFHEKPSVGEAAALFRAGALLNTFIFAARAVVLAELIATRARGWCRAMVSAAHDEDLLDATYAVLPPSNFSTDVLEHVPGRLRVLAVDDMGWSDIGTPERLERALGPVRPRLQRRLVKSAG